MLGREPPQKGRDALPSELVEALEDVATTIASLTERIGDYDRRMERVCKERACPAGRRVSASWGAPGLKGAAATVPGSPAA